MTSLSLQQEVVQHYKQGKSPFWPSNSYPSLILAIEFQNRVSLTIQLLKRFTIGHQTVLTSGLNFFIYNLVLRS
jgi:hypothetical protein